MTSYSRGCRLTAEIVERLQRAAVSNDGLHRNVQASIEKLRNFLHMLGIFPRKSLSKNRQTVMRTASLT